MALPWGLMDCKSRQVLQLPSLNGHREGFTGKELVILLKENRLSLWGLVICGLVPPRDSSRNTGQGIKTDP